MTDLAVRFLQKAEGALLASIEVYNKPTFEYREETFAILALNAWELLLKAKLLAENGNRTRSLYVTERRPKRAGGPVALCLKRNRSGTPLSHGLGKVISELENRSGVKLAPAIKGNLEALTEVRDSAVHFVVASPQLAKQVLEVGTAAVRNFVELARLWFHHDMSGRHFFLMPIGFADASSGGSAVILSNDESKLISFLAQMASNVDASDGPFNIALDVNLSFKRTQPAGALAIAISNDPSAPEMRLTDDDFKKIYKWTYDNLLKALKKRYSDFKSNAKFSGIKRPLMADPKFVRARFLDPDNPKSGKKDFYSPAILGEFDKHYTRHAA